MKSIQNIEAMMTIQDLGKESIKKYFMQITKKTDLE